MSQLKSLRNLQIILASTAPWRSQVLEQLGITHRSMAPRFVEPSFQGGSVEEHVMKLAKGKADSLEKDFPSALIIAADQLAEIEGEVLGKPGDEEAALEQLNRLNGRTHHLINGLCVLFEGKCVLKSNRSNLTMRNLEQPELVNYVVRDNPIDCAGSYKIESLGASLFENMDTPDLTSIIGLPTGLLMDSLRELGFSNLL